MIWVESVTARGRLALGLGLLLLAGGLAGRYLVLAGIGVALLLLVLAEMVSVAASSRLTVTRVVEPLVVVRGEPCAGSVTVHGRLRSGLVRTDAADLVDGARIPVALPNVRGREAASATYPIPTTRRGLHDVGPLLLRRHGLSGMAARSTTDGAPVRLRVLPRRVPIRDLMPGHRRAVAGGDDSLEYGGTDLVDLHEYTMGDDLRRLHWATSARTGRLMVREDAEPSEPHVLVLLDDRAEAYPEAEAFEDAVEFAAGLCRAATARGAPLRLAFTSAREQIVVPGSSTRQPRQEAQDIEFLLSEILPVSDGLPRWHTGLDLDIAVAVTGSERDLRTTTEAIGNGRTRIIAVVDRGAVVGVSQHDDVLVLRGPGSGSLAGVWDQAANR